MAADDGGLALNISFDPGELGGGGGAFGKKRNKWAERHKVCRSVLAKAVRVWRAHRFLGAARERDACTPQS